MLGLLVPKRAGTGFFRKEQAMARLGLSGIGIAAALWAASLGANASGGKLPATKDEACRLYEGKRIAYYSQIFRVQQCKRHLLTEDLSLVQQPTIVDVPAE